MADLSDLDTTQIGIIAFWNALDHRAVPGIGDVDPTDCIAIFDSYDVYDNGIEGYKALGSGKYFHARVKTDGWIVAWIDRTNTFAYPNKSAADFGEGAHSGYYDILYNWSTSSTNISTTYTTLSYLLSLLYAALSNSADFTFTASNVGHYCYSHPLASVLTLMDIRLPELPVSESKEGYVQYATGTTLYYAAATGLAQSTGTGTINCNVKFAANDLINLTPGWEVKHYGAADILTEGWMPTPLTNYNLHIDNGTCLVGVCAAEVHGSIIIIWA